MWGVYEEIEQPEGGVTYTYVIEKEIRNLPPGHENRRSVCSTAANEKNCSVFKGKNAGVRPPLTLTLLPYSQL